MEKNRKRIAVWLWHCISFLLLMAAAVLLYHYSGSPHFQEALKSGGSSDIPGVAELARIISLLKAIGTTLVISLAMSFAGMVIVYRKEAMRGMELWYTEIPLLGIITFSMIMYVALNEMRYGYLTHSGLDIFAGASLFTLSWYPLVRFLLSMFLRIFEGTFFEQMLIVQGFRAVYDSFRERKEDKRSSMRVLKLFFYQLFNILLGLSAATAAVSRHLTLAAVAVFMLIVLNLWYLLGIAKRSVQLKKIFDRMNGMAVGDLESKIDTSGMAGDLKSMAETVNAMSESMDVAVRERTRSERMRTELIANVSHDLRTPLTSIINYVDLIRRENVPNPKVDEYLNVLEEKSMRLKTMAEALMEATRAESGNLKMNFVEIDMVQMIHQVFGEFQEQFEEKGLVPVLSLVEPPAIIRADGKILFRVLDNLFTNVIKYAKPDTQVLIELAETAHNLIFTMKNVSKSKLVFSADELTERFVRGDDSRSTEGSGLGLSIAKSMTEQLGGRFDIFPDEEMFRVRLVFTLASPNIHTGKIG